MSQTIFRETTPYRSSSNIELPLASKCPTNYKPAFIFAVIIIIALIVFLWWRWYSQKEDMKEGLINFWFSVDGEEETPELKKLKEDTADCVVDKISVSDYLKYNNKFLEALEACTPA